MRCLANKKKSILMQILITEFIVEVLPLQDKRLKSGCKNFMSSSVNEHTACLGDYVRCLWGCLYSSE